MIESVDLATTDSLLKSKAAYEAWHAQLAVDQDTNTPWHGLVKSHLSPARDLAEKRVLEIACGRGGFACWLANRPQPPAEVVASDLAATGVAKGRAFATERGINGITWQVADIQAIDHEDESFDTVISCETIEHVPAPRQAVYELSRVLKPGGRLFLTTPNYLGTLGMYRAYLRLRGRRFAEEGQPINNFTLFPLTRSWVSRAGLRVRSLDAVGHYLPFPGRRPIELRALNNPRTLMRWFGLHSLVVAEKL